MNLNRHLAEDRAICFELVSKPGYVQAHSLQSEKKKNTSNGFI